uniref:Mitochondrial import inner membrane translocase subunit tim16-B n=1 Tax=Phallusia mammillata TaxID=59560 RepID=A0A6F9DMG5_9ASCI|nr:mitochondrial import inner membrane translocase subunit tim16-B [Phallusia mammillata]
MANNLVKVIMAGMQVVGRAFTRAVRKEFNASKQAAERAGGGAQGAKSASSSSLFGMTLDEAKQILNVSDPANAEQVLKNYEHLMKANEKSTGGSFYLQSKVYRAKERIDSEMGSDASSNSANEAKKESIET